MDWWRRALGIDLPDQSEAVDQATSAPTFAVDENAIPPSVVGLETYAVSTSPAPRVERRAAIQCGAVARAHDLVPATCGGLRLQLIGPDLLPNTDAAAATLFEQPERNVARSITMTRLFEDLWFEGVGWWDVTEKRWDQYPLHVKRLRPGRVVVNDDTGKVYVDGKERTDHSTLIRFDAPSDGLLIKGARAIRTLLKIEARADINADASPAVDYFTPDPDADDFDDDEVKEMLTSWEEQRRLRKTGFVPLSVKLNAHGWNPDQLKLVEQRDQAVVEVARHAGVDSEDLGVATTSRTYFNAGDRRKHRVDFTLAKLLIAVSDRLAMGDVTPRGYFPRFNLDELERSDTKTLYETYEIGLRIGATTLPEIRDELGKPQLPDDRPTAPVRAIASAPIPSAEETA